MAVFASTPVCRVAFATYILTEPDKKSLDIGGGRIGGQSSKKGQRRGKGRQARAGNALWLVMAARGRGCPRPE